MRGTKRPEPNWRHVYHGHIIRRADCGRDGLPLSGRPVHGQGWVLEVGPEDWPFPTLAEAKRAAAAMSEARP